LTVTFKITENKLVAELVIVESEKEREEEAAPPPPKKPSKSKPDCLACYDGKRYSSEHKKKIVPLCYNEHDKLYQDLRYPELFSKSKKGKTKARKKWNRECITKIKERKEAKEEEARRQAEEEARNRQH